MKPRSKRQILLRRVVNGLRYLSRGDLRGLARGVRTVWNGQTDEIARTALADVLGMFAPAPVAVAPLVVETDILIPVYNGVELLSPLFASLLRNTHSPYRLIIVDDCSTDSRIRPILENVVLSSPNTLLLHNERNLGFIGSINRAAKQVRSNFVLLNTDVEVPPGWLERLMAPLLKDPKIASATPFTNAGTICSFPVMNQDNPLPAGSTVDQVDAAFRHVMSDCPYVELPSGVGFCMAVNHAVWSKIGGFDAAFGRGFGEENDWCQRAKRAGFLNVLAANLFVYHKHGGSFPSVEKQQLLSSNLQTLRRRYPSYDRDVRKFIKRDTLAGLRQFLKLLVARYLSPTGVLIADHQIGGGANTYRRNAVAQRLQSGDAVLVCTPSLRNRAAYELDLFLSWGEARFSFDDLNDLSEVARYLAIGEVFVNNLVDWPRPLAALTCFTDIKHRTGARLTLPVHDFYSICPSYNLLNKDGRYCDLPAITDCRQCLPKNRFAHNPESADIDTWRARWRELIAGAHEVLCFSNNSLSLLQRVYYLGEGRGRVQPHDLKTKFSTKPQVSFEHRLHIGIVGGINHAKGAAIVAGIAALIEKADDGTTLSVIGLYDGWLSGKHLRVTGPYIPEQLPHLLSDLGVNMCFLPSIWPETYSFVTSELINLGMPLCVFDLGAPAERVRGYEKGCVIETVDPGDALQTMRRFYESLRNGAVGFPAANYQALASTRNVRLYDSSRNPRSE